MPLVAHNELPVFQRLKDSGEVVLSLDRATKQDIRELHIGFLNMMPDAALTATESQFIRFVGACNQIAQIYVYPFSIAELNRDAKAEAHISQHYFDFDTLKEEGLDALIITGTNVSNPSLDQELFWGPLMEVVGWAEENVASVLCSCLATHAVVQHNHGIRRSNIGQKKWGVYQHHIARPGHPLMRDVNTRFDAPHSRYNEITREQLEAAGLKILVEAEDAGVHLAVSPDQFRMVYFQGHPEYDAISLLKEYKREVMRFFSGEREHGPRYPENYMSAEAQEIARAYFHKAEKAAAKDEPLPPFPDAELEALVDNTWGDTGKAIINNWLGLVYGLTSVDRHEQFMPGVDPDDPLGLSR